MLFFLHTLIFFFFTKLGCPEFAIAFFSFFLLSKSLGVCFFSLNVEFDESGIFGAVLCDASLCLGYIDLVYEVES